MKDIRFSNLKASPLADFLLDIKFIGKEYTLDLLEYAFTIKGHQALVGRRKFYDLAKKGYFDISKENNKTFFRVSKKGKGLVEMLKLATGQLEWDKKWRVLIFDIPEKQRRKRDYLRNKLIELGFKLLQGSVWITPYPLPDSFSDFLAEIKVRPYLYSLTVDAINREDELKREFGL